MLVNYDDDKAVEFIRGQMPVEMSESLTDDDIHYVIDLIYEFYENEGFLDENDDSEVEIEDEDVIEYAIEAVAEDDLAREYTDEEIAYIIKGELDYCDSIDIFD